VIRDLPSGLKAYGVEAATEGKKNIEYRTGNIEFRIEKIFWIPRTSRGMTGGGFPN